jgi:hypothetical protein
MGRQAEGTGLREEMSGPATGVHDRLVGSRALGVSFALLGTIWGTGCVNLWPTSHATVAAAPADVFACAAAQAKQMGYHVGPDTTRGLLTAEKTRSFQDRGPDVTEYSRQDILAVSLGPAQSSAGSAVTIEAETISVQESRRGMADVPITASPEVRADADTLLSRCRHAAPNTSLP